MDGRSGLDTLDRLDALCRELHPLTCAGPALRPALARHADALRGLAGRDAGAEAIARDADALCALAAAHRTGGPVEGHAAALDPPAADAERACAAAEGAAGGTAHPVVRAARVFAAAAGALGDGGQLRPLPWALASLALLGAGRPPLVADRGIAPRLTPGGAAGAPGAARAQRAAVSEEALTSLFIDLQLAQLRDRLTGATAAPASASGPLAASVHRSLAAHLDRRCGPLRLVLRELDPDARVEVDSGDRADGPDAVRCDRAAARVLVRPGPASPWVRMRMRTSGAEAELLAAVRDIGDPPTGALAVVADAAFSGAAGPGGAAGAEGAAVAAGANGSEEAPPESPPGATDCVTLVPGDSAGGRRPDIEAFLDDALSRAVDRLTRAAAFDHV